MSRVQAQAEVPVGGLLLAAVESLPAGVLVYGESGGIRFLNRRGREILGFGGTSLDGVTVQSLLGSLPHRGHGGRSLGGIRAECVLVRPDSPERHLGFEVRSIAVDAGAPPGGHVVLFQDVTHLQKVRKERERDLLVRSMSRLLPTIAHEIKNPLAAIQSVVEVLLGELADDGVQRDLESILNEVTRLRLLIDRMGLADQRLCTEGERGDLVPTIERSLHLIRHRAEQLGVELDYIGSARVVAAVHPDLLLTVLHNLLNNSLDACRGGGVIEVAMSCSQGHFELAVSDTGEGMSSETLRRSSELFYTTKPSGSGIGLAVTREIVERSGGTLSLSSKPGEGTQVVLRVPEVGR